MEGVSIFTGFFILDTFLSVAVVNPAVAGMLCQRQCDRLIFFVLLIWFRGRTDAGAVEYPIDRLDLAQGNVADRLPLSEVILDMQLSFTETNETYVAFERYAGEPAGSLLPEILEEFSELEVLKRGENRFSEVVTAGHSEAQLEQLRESDNAYLDLVGLGEEMSCRIGPSRDGKGRKKYPMIVGVPGGGV